MTELEALRKEVEELRAEVSRLCARIPPVQIVPLPAGPLYQPPYYIGSPISTGWPYRPEGGHSICQASGYAPAIYNGAKQ